MSADVLFVSTRELAELLRLHLSPRQVRRYARSLGLPRVNGRWAVAPDALAAAVVAATRPGGGVRPTATSPGPATSGGRKQKRNSTQVVDLKGNGERVDAAPRLPVLPNPQPVDNKGKVGMEAPPSEPTVRFVLARLADE